MAGREMGIGLFFLFENVPMVPRYTHVQHIWVCMQFVYVQVGR